MLLLITIYHYKKYYKLVRFNLNASFFNLKKYDNKWCNPGLYGAGNTMCIYEDGAVSSCGDVKSRKVTSQVRVKRNHHITQKLIFYQFKDNIVVHNMN